MDFLVALVLIAVLLFIYYVAPLNHRISGYWRDPEGHIYLLKNGALLRGGVRYPLPARWGRRVGANGRLSADGRVIHWAGGSFWVRQAAAPSV